MAVTNVKAVDPILVSVIKNRLDVITKEMGQVMLRTTRSPIFSEARDFVTAIYDRYGRNIAQTSYIPVLVGATPWAIRAFAEAFEDDMQDGDIYILNDPYKGNNHSPDITIAKPVFYEGKLAYWALSKGHHIDIGGKGVVGYNPLATSIYDEGLQIPPVKLYEAGKPNKSLIRLFLNNVILAPLVEGDLEAQIGAVQVGERLIKKLVGKYGMSCLDQVTEAMLDAAERQMRAAIRNIPDGIYTGEAIVDNDGLHEEPRVHIRVTSTVSGDEITFDFNESDSQVDGYLNSPIPNTVSATHIGLYLTIEPTIPRNEGATRPIHVLADSGKVVNPLPPAPVVLCTVSATEAIVEAVLDSLSHAMPERVPAGWSRMFMPNTTGINYKNQRPFGELHAISRGGSGAMPNGVDGYDHIGSVVTLGGFRASDPEIFELTTPFLLRYYGYQQDSGGPGESRGGLGITAEFEIGADNLGCVDWGNGALPETAAVGRQGGHSGIPNYHRIIHADGSMYEPHPNQFIEIRKGDHFQIVAGGGGGYGDPRKRPVERVLHDVKEGFVSVKQAREMYAVVTDEHGALDAEATAKLRGDKY